MQIDAENSSRAGFGFACKRVKKWEILMMFDVHWQFVIGPPFETEKSCKISLVSGNNSGHKNKFRRENIFPAVSISARSQSADVVSLIMSPYDRKKTRENRRTKVYQFIFLSRKPFRRSQSSSLRPKIFSKEKPIRLTESKQKQFSSFSFNT